MPPRARNTAKTTTTEPTTGPSTPSGVSPDEAQAMTVTVEELTAEETADAEQRWTEQADRLRLDEPAQKLAAASLAGVLGQVKELADRLAEVERAHDVAPLHEAHNILADRLAEAESSWDAISTYFNDRLGTLEVASPAPKVDAIYPAIWAMMNDVQGVGKHGQMDARSGAGNYMYRKYDDLKRELGAAARAHGVMAQSTVLDVVNEHPFKDDRKTRVQVHMRYRFTSLVDGSSVAFESIGESIDVSDKASGKAMTMALKSALDQAFMLAAEDIEDPDATRPDTAEDPRYQPRTVEQTRQRYDGGAPPADYRVGDQVTVAGTTFTKHSDGPAIPADPWDQGPPKDTRTPEEQAQAAADKLNAPGLTMDRWNKIMDHVRGLGLMDVQVTTPQGQSALKHVAVAIGRTL